MKKIIGNFTIVMLSLVMVTSSVQAAVISTKPDATFFNQSWSQNAKAGRYQMSCSYTLSKAASLTPLKTDKEKKLLELTKKVFAGYQKSNSGTLISKDKMTAGSAKKIDVAESIITMYKDGSITYEQALAKLKDKFKLAGSFVITPTQFFYSSSTTWKVFTDSDSASSFFASITKNGLDNDLDKGTFKFNNWATKTDKVRLAVYNGKLNTDGTNQLAKSIFGESGVEAKTKASVTLSVNEKTKDWEKFSSQGEFTSGNLKFTITEICQAVFGDKVKITVPQGAETKDATAGLQEFIDLISSL